MAISARKGTPTHPHTYTCTHPHMHTPTHAHTHRLVEVVNLGPPVGKVHLVGQLLPALADVAVHQWLAVVGGVTLLVEVPPTDISGIQPTHLPKKSR